MDTTNSNDTTQDEVAARTGREMRGPVAENSEGTSDSGTVARPTAPSDSTNSGQAPAEMGTPPEMNCETDESGETNCEPPALPEGEEGQMPSEMGGGFRGGFMEQQVATSSEAVWHPAAYLAMGGGSVVLGLVISYACFSKFFHLRPGQTFSSRGKFLAFVGVAVAIAVGLCVLGYFIPVWVG